MISPSRCDGAYVTPFGSKACRESNSGGHSDRLSDIANSRVDGLLEGTNCDGIGCGRSCGVLGTARLQRSSSHSRLILLEATHTWDHPLMPRWVSIVHGSACPVTHVEAAMPSGSKRHRALPAVPASCDKTD